MSEVEELPEGWVETKLSRVTAINPGVNIFELPDSTLVSFVPMSAVEAGTGRVDSSTQRKLGEVKRGYTAFQEGDILFAKITPCMENGKSAVAHSLSSKIGFGSTEFHVLRPEEGINPKLLYYYVSQELFRQMARSAMTGSAGQLRVPATFLADVSYPLAPTNEQHRVVAAIEQQFTRLDGGVASLQRAKAKLKSYRAAVLKAAVDGKLTEEWRAEHPGIEPASELLERILKERRAKWEAEHLARMHARGVVPKDDRWKEGYKEPALPDIENLPGLPEEWVWATVAQIAQIQGGIQKQPNRTPRNNAFPYLRVANVFRGHLDLIHVEKMELFGDELETLRLKIDDLLVVEGNGSKTEIGRSALWKGEIQDCVHQNHIIRVRLSHIVPQYLDYYWNSSEGNKRVMDVAASTTGLYTLSINKISRLPVPLPSLAEQEQIVAVTEEHLSIIAELEKAVETSLNRAERERQSILQKAFSGQLVAQDPNDEPASILLERIQEERVKREKEEQRRRKEAQMNEQQRKKVRKTPTDTRSLPLHQVLLEVNRPITADDLLRELNVQADTLDDFHDTINDFYRTLRDEMIKGRIRRIPQEYERDLLEAVPE